MYHDEDDQYIGNVNTSGVIQIWRTSDGAVIPIDYSAVPGTNATPASCIAFLQNSEPFIPVPFTFGNA